MAVMESRVKEIIPNAGHCSIRVNGWLDMFIEGTRSIEHDVKILTSVLGD